MRMAGKQEVIRAAISRQSNQLAITRDCTQHRPVLGAKHKVTISEIVKKPRRTRSVSEMAWYQQLASFRIGDVLAMRMFFGTSK